MKTTSRAEQRYAGQGEVKQEPIAAVARKPQSGILAAIGPVTFERLSNGRWCVRHPVPGGSEFASDQEKEAREYYQSVARAEKGYPSGFDPCGEPKALGSPAKGQAETFNARAVRKLCKDVVPLGNFLGVGLVEMSKVLALVDQAECDEAEKTRTKQALLRFQAKERLTSLRGKEGQ